jgi:hypothetical protein
MQRQHAAVSACAQRACFAGCRTQTKDGVFPARNIILEI